MVDITPILPPNYNVLGRSDYTPSADLPTRVLGWAREAHQEGDYYLRNQPGYRRGEELRRLVLGDDRPWGDGDLSATSDNEVGRLFGVQSADLTDFRPYWQYESFNDMYEQQVRIQSAILTSWFPKFGERPTELIVKTAILNGCGVGNLAWDPHRQEIALNACHPHDVKPVRPADTGSFQDCFAVVERRERPVNFVKSAFPHAAHLIKTVRDASYAGMISTAASRVFGATPITYGTPLASPPSKRLGSLPVVDLYYLYVDDRSINDSDETVEMGDWGDGNNGERISLNDWSYHVAPNDPLYPLKRLIIYTDDCLLYDGPSNYWHGMFPYVKLVLETVPDLWFGISRLWRCIPLQRSLDRLYRAIDNHVQKIVKPGKQAPKIGVAAAELRRYRTDLPGQEVRYGPAGKIEVDEIPDLDPIVPAQIDRILARMQQHAGVQQLSNLLTLGQIPEGNTVEKLMYSLAPETRASSRSIEAFQRELGTMFAYDTAEFYPVGRRVEMLGSDGVTISDYDLDPYSFIPMHVGSDYDVNGRVKPEFVSNPRPRFDRGREFLRQFSLNIKPASMLNSADTTEKLMTLTLRRQGDMPLYHTLKKLGLSGLGPEPKGSLIDQITLEKAGLPPAGSTMSPQLLSLAGQLLANPALMQLVTTLQAAVNGGGGDGSGGGAPGGVAGGGGGTPLALGNPGTGSSGSDSPPGFGPHRGPGHPPSAQELPHQRPDGRMEESS